MKRKTILLVEDNPDDATLTVRALNKGGFAGEVVVLGDGAEAVDWLFGTGEHADRDTTVMPDLVLLDLNMPKLGGLEVLWRMQTEERTSRIPVVILTSSDAERDIVQSRQLGAALYARKPLEVAEFANALKGLGLQELLPDVPPTKEG